MQWCSDACDPENACILSCVFLWCWWRVGWLYGWEILWTCIVSVKLGVVCIWYLFCNVSYCITCNAHAIRVWHYDSKILTVLYLILIEIMSCVRIFFIIGRKVCERNNFCKCGLYIRHKSSLWAFSSFWISTNSMWILFKLFTALVNINASRLVKKRGFFLSIFCEVFWHGHRGTFFFP